MLGEGFAADAYGDCISSVLADRFRIAKIGKVEKETYADGTVHYEFDLKLANGDIEEVEFNDEGEKLDDH